MSSYDMVCGECRHTYEISRRGALRDKDKVCPQCGSGDTRQTFASFLRNWSSGSGSSSCGPRIGGFG